jgi:hypothetical protein
MLVRLAWDTYPRDMEKKDLSIILERYLKYLYLRKNEELSAVQLPSINRKMITKMREYYKVINNEIPPEASAQKEAEDTDSLFDKLAKKMEKELTNAPQLGIDFSEILKVLDR